MFYNILLHIHSILRWFILVFLILAWINAFLKRRGAVPVCRKCEPDLITMRLAQAQFVVGLVLYFISPKVIFAASSFKNPVLRFFLVEHIVIMIAVVALISIGAVRASGEPDERRKNKLIMVFFGIAFILILLGVPWPFLNLGGGWY